MVMAIFRDDGTEQFEFAIPLTVGDSASTTASAPSTVPLVLAKLQMPAVREHLDREWLVGLLERSRKNSSATMLIGRAGSGKTVLAADFVKRTKDQSWYSIDSSDTDWTSFQRYFRAAVVRENGRRKRGRRSSVQAEAGFSPSPIELFADVTAALELSGQDWPSVIVLDGIHHLYDCRWFPEFFSLFVASIPHKSHAVMIGRSRPAAPVWRMRSKQVLNVIDEKLLAFSLPETQELFDLKGLDHAAAQKVHASAFGRPSDIMAFLESASENHAL